MHELIIFDLDGVLVDARDLHYYALNKALSTISITHEYTIEYQEHLSTYDGLPTKRKLVLLTEQKGLPESKHNEVWELKQRYTIDVINEKVKPLRNVTNTLQRCKERGLQVAVASNAIRSSVKQMLLRAELIEYVDFFVSNQDVFRSKPSAEIYLRCMITAGVNPNKTIIVEDSYIGRKAAQASGATLCAVTDPRDLSWDKIEYYLSSKNTAKPKWQGNDMNVLIPMAGAGKRFAEAGYSFPKPLIDVRGKPMIQLVVENLNIDAKHIFIVQKEHREHYALDALLNLLAPGCEVIDVDGVTEGAACTTLLAKELINNDAPLLIANSDQYLEWNSNEFMYSAIADNVDGSIPTFTATHPKWSFVKLNAEGFVIEVAEKKPISDKATTGIYYWSRGKDYVSSAEQMISKNIRTNNEFYVAPAYNEAIANGAKIKTYPWVKMHGLGTPEDLREFLNDSISL